MYLEDREVEEQRLTQLTPEAGRILHKTVFSSRDAH
jgi:hypothetical protein